MVRHIERGCVRATHKESSVDWYINAGSNPALTTKNINMETKQTAIEFLEEILHDFIHPEHGAEFFPYLEKAKAMEKQQIIDAYNNGDLRSAELYYDETYGNSKTPPGAHCEEA